MNTLQTGGTDVRAGDPRIDWSGTEAPTAPTLRQRRDGILPTVAAALSVHGTTLTGTAARGEEPPTLHPLVQDFLDTLPSAQRDRFTAAAPKPSSSPGTSPPPTPPAANAPPADP